VHSTITVVKRMQIICHSIMTQVMVSNRKVFLYVNVPESTQSYDG